MRSAGPPFFDNLILPDTPRCAVRCDRGGLRQPVVLTEQAGCQSWAASMRCVSARPILSARPPLSAFVPVYRYFEERGDLLNNDFDG